MTRIAVFALAAATLSACSATPPPTPLPVPAPDPQTRARCTAADWRATGYRHGVSGYPVSALAALGRECGAAGAKVDRLAYSTGRLEGLARFCTYETGFRLAQAGDGRDSPCPPSLSEAFEAGRRDGGGS